MPSKSADVRRQQAPGSDLQRGKNLFLGYQQRRGLLLQRQPLGLRGWFLKRQLAFGAEAGSGGARPSKAACEESLIRMLLTGCASALPASSTISMMPSSSP